MLACIALQKAFLQYRSIEQVRARISYIPWGYLGYYTIQGRKL